MGCVNEADLEKKTTRVSLERKRKFRNAGDRLVDRRVSGITSIIWTLLYQDHLLLMMTLL